MKFDVRNVIMMDSTRPSLWAAKFMTFNDINELIWYNYLLMSYYPSTNQKSVLTKNTLIQEFKAILARRGFSSLKPQTEFVIETSKTLFSNLKAMSCRNKQQNVAVALFITLACCVIGDILLKIFVR